jgi:hypothetical protein
MARKIILDTAYTFTPSTKTIVIPRFIARERLILITNVTTNQVIFNFSDPALKATSFVNATTNMVESTTIVLNYNTAAMSATDKLQITIDEFVEKFEPADTLLDPTNKLRTSSPQALIDTDFEYGMQVSKWENLALTNNRPFAYAYPAFVPFISGIAMPQNGRTVTVTTSANHGLSIGMAITVQDTYLNIANGNFIIETIPSATTFTYTARAVNTSSTITAIFDGNKTAIYQGTIYTNAAIGAAPTMSYSGQAITVVTTVPHGLSLGNEIAVLGTTASTNAPNGSFSVATIISPTSFVYYVPAAPTGTLTSTSAVVYVRPQAQFLHRPFDGGVIFTSNASSNGGQAIRQTRRYFRYQSGKGIQISSGTILKPNLHIDSMTSNGATVTVQTKEQHNILPGTSITISGANETGYNGTFTVNNVTGFNSFQYTALATPSATPASGTYYAAINGWYGATSRLGMFDHQNGLFFEFDGQTINAVRRNSTYQIAGKVTVTNGSNTVTQTDASLPTSFNKQLLVGDYIVLRGQSYRIQDISSDTSLTITPSYRGATSQFVVVSKTIDTKVPQSAWNIDKMDGTGPSGYTLDLSKMQMFYIDYTWYGAGFVRWGLRGPNGNVTYVHRMPNNNVNSEAYMRSGNLPGRYETNTFSKVTQITSSVGATDTTLNVLTTTGFSPSGTAVIRSGSVAEYVNYTGITGTTLTGLTRGQAGVTAGTTVTIAAGSNIGTVSSITGIQIGQRVVHTNFPDNTFVSAITGTTITFSNAAVVANPTGVIFAPMGAASGQAFTYSATTPVAVEQAWPTYAPTISHWGTSVIMDGRYDDDKSLLFTFGQTAFTSVPTSATVTPTLTGTSGAYTVTVSSATGVLVGMSVTAVGVGAGAVVTGLSGTTATLSVPNTAAMSGTASSFVGGNTRALFSIRVSPSVDNGTPAPFGARELVNRMQLILRALDVTTSTAGANFLVTATINGTPSTATAWTNAVKNAVGVANSSLAQLADYSAGSTITTGGEVTGGFLVSGTSSVELDKVRDLGNSILGGGGVNANSTTYPDGPDVLTLSVTNLGAAVINVLGRLSWSEAQA